MSPVNINIGGRIAFTSASKGGTYTGMVQVQVRRLLGETLSVNLPITLTFWNSLSMSQITPLSFGELQVSGQQNPVRTDENGGVLISDIEPYQKQSSA